MTIILKRNASQSDGINDTIDIIDQSTTRYGKVIRGVYGSLHIDLLFNEADEVYDYLNEGKAVVIDISVNKDWLLDQREMDK